MATIDTEGLARRRFSGQEVRRMLATGVIVEDEPLELIDGELIVMVPQGPAHRSTTVILDRALARIYEPDAHVQVQCPISLGEYDLPEPDIAVVRGDPRDYVERLPQPADIILVVEAAVTSHAVDRLKAGTYASAGLPTYWLVDIPGRRVEVHSQPFAEGTYEVVTILSERQTLRPPNTDEVRRVSDILP